MVNGCMMNNYHSLLPILIDLLDNLILVYPHQSMIDLDHLILVDPSKMLILIIIIIIESNTYPNHIVIYINSFEVCYFIIIQSYTNQIKLMRSSNQENYTKDVSNLIC